MSLLNDQIRKDVKQMLADVANPVTFKVFSQQFECQYCKETRELMEEVASLSDKLSVEVYDFERDKALADELGIDKIPGAAIVGAKDYGIRLFGIPSGYEFGTLIEDIKLVSEGDSGLSPATRAQVAKFAAAGEDPGLHHSYLTVLSASRVARAPTGSRERPHTSRHGGSSGVSALGQCISGDGRATHRDR